MCGIVGKVVFNEGQKVSKDTLTRMHEKITHRGPDDHGVYVNNIGNVGFGHRRLSIIDLSPAGHNPMPNEDETVWIVFNGEIYNFQELRPELEKKGHQFRSNTDTEVIVHLWEEYGVDCVKHLRGMFAFAIWDERKKQLFMARDRLGKKPLKYYIDDKVLLFGSELKSFIDEPEISKEMDLEAIHYYLTFQYVPHPLTGFKHVKKLPQSHYLLVDLSGDDVKTELKQYWSLDYTKTLSLREEEWEERILAKLDEAVRTRMISDVPLGAFLSGGVDSSAVVSFMAEASNQPVRTFSIGFEEEAFSELPYARQVAERYETDHQEFIVDPQNIDILPNLVYHYEEPYADSSALPTYYLAEMTREHVTVALNGDGGDENFAGYPWYWLMRRDALYRRVPKFIRKMNAELISLMYKMFPIHFLRYGELFTEGSLTPPSEVHTEILSYFSKNEKHALYTEAFQEDAQKWPSSAHLDHYYKESQINDPIHRAMFTDINTYLANDLNVKVDIATMTHSLEARSPFLDHEFMELTAQMPSSLKWRGGQGKYLLKKALKKRLPHDLLYRKKQGFGIPVNEWFRDSLKEYSREMLLSENAFPKGMFSQNGLKNLLDNHEKTPKDGRRIWMLITLKLWMDQYFRTL